MVFDTRTLSSFSALADVVGEYTAPARSRVEMTDQQERDACMLRYLHGWHAEHIAEALGLANANYAFNWRENVTEALEKCALSDYWNTQRIRLSPGQQISAEGTNPYGGARSTAFRNAVAQVLITDPTTRTAGERDISRRRGKEIPGTSLMDKAFAIIDRQIADGSFRGERPNLPGRQNLNRYIRDMEALGFVWEGAGRTQIMADLPEDIRILVDSEIQRQCQAQLDAGGAEIQRKRSVRQAPLNYSAIARNVFSTLIINERFGDTLESMGYPAINVGYVREVCQQAGITTDIRRTLAEQAADETNIKMVQDERARDPRSTSYQIFRRIGIQLPIVEEILDNLGLPRAGRGYTSTAIRKIILDAHSDGLMAEQMLEKHSELVEYFKDNVNPTPDVIRQILRRAGKTPITEEGIEAAQTEERRAPLVASNIKATLFGWLNDLKEQRSFGRLYLEIPSNAEIAALLNESESLVSEAIGLLLAEERPIIQIVGGVTVIPNIIQSRFERGEISRWEFSAN
tara:strand:- start:137 stop:1684 length:1548 start_codon:yes stop_codon:yes gene_type:complete